MIMYYPSQASPRSSPTSPSSYLPNFMLSLSLKLIQIHKNKNQNIQKINKTINICDYLSPLVVCRVPSSIIEYRQQE